MAMFIRLYCTETWSHLGKTEQNYCLLKLYLIQWKYSEAAERRKKPDERQPIFQDHFLSPTAFPFTFFFHMNKSLTKDHLSFMTTFALLLSWCLTSTKTIRLITDGERGGG